jgi:hypothetical protein
VKNFIWEDKIMKLIKSLSAAAVSLVVASAVAVSASATDYTDAVQAATDAGVQSHNVQELSNFLEPNADYFTSDEYDDMIADIQAISDEYVAPYATDLFDKEPSELTEEEKIEVGKQWSDEDKQAIIADLVALGDKYGVEITVTQESESKYSVAAAIKDDEDGDGDTDGDTDTDGDEDTDGDGDSDGDEDTDGNDNNGGNSANDNKTGGSTTPTTGGGNGSSTGNGGNTQVVSGTAVAASGGTTSAAATGVAATAGLAVVLAATGAIIVARKNKA